ncbi:MAG: hypothetical protein ACLQT5_13775, partial [Steroidobacteraceae bacterium]
PQISVKGVSAKRRVRGRASAMSRKCIIKSVGNFSAAKGTAPFVDPRLKAQFIAAFPDNALKNIHWYPAIPPGLEEIEGRVMDRIKAAN